VSNILFKCQDCDGDVVGCYKDGRFFEHRGVFTLLPADFNIPRCLKCGQDWFNDELIKNLEIVLEAEYQKHVDLINSIVELYEHRTQK